MGFFVIIFFTGNDWKFKFFWLNLLICPSVIIPVVNLFLFLTTNIPNFFSLKIFNALIICIFSFTKGIFFPVIIISSTVFSCAPRLPAGCNFLKSILPNFLYFIVAIAKASPKAS